MVARCMGFKDARNEMKLRYLKPTSAQILPTVDIVSTGYKPRRVSAPRRIASLPAGRKIRRRYHDKSCDP